MNVQSAAPAKRRIAPLAAVSAVCFAFPLWAAQQTGDTQPAPVVRVRPRTQTTVPATAPPDAAPLVPHVPRVKPINPQALSGVGAATGQNAPLSSTSRPAQTPTGSSTSPATRPAVTAQAGAPVAPHHTTARPTGPTGTTTLPATAVGTAPAKQTLSTTGLNRTVIVLDPAHGGTDSGSRIGDTLLEKNITLSLALRLRSLLTARGFTVVLTRESDSLMEDAAAGTPLTLDDRAGIANHARAAACLLLHATGRGNGLHLYTSELEPATGEAALLPWLTAQAAWIPASQQMERSLSSALGRSHVALVSSVASIRPVDSLTCPAMVMELAPEDGDPKSVNDAGYQDRIASAVAGALIFWQNQVQAPPKLSSAPAATHTPRRRAATTDVSTAPTARVEREP